MITPRPSSPSPEIDRRPAPENQSVTIRPAYPSGSSLERNLALEGLRGLCAVSVLFGHVAYDSTGFRTARARFDPGFPADTVAAFGSIGVLLFFVLSGYVIGLTTRSSYSRTEACRYLVRRLVRLYPIYFVALLISFAVAGVPISSWEFLGHLVFLQTWAVPTVGSNGALWTLHLEFMFYLLFLAVWSGRVSLAVALSVCALSAVLSPFIHSHPIRVLAYFFVWLLGVALARAPLTDRPPTRFWALLFLGVSFSSANPLEVLISKTGAPEWRGYLSTLSVLVESGVLLGIIACLVRRSSPALKIWLAVSTMASVACVAVYTLFLFSKASIVAIPVNRLALTFASLAGCAYFLSFPAPERTLIRLAWVGSISYGIYVIHTPIVHAAFSYVPAYWGLDRWWTVAALVMVAAVVAAAGLELWFQPRVKKLLTLA